MGGPGPVLLAVGGAFAGTQFAWSNYVGYELVDLVSSAASLLAGVVVLRFWRPAEEWRFEHDKPGAAGPAGLADEIDGPAVAKADTGLTAGRVARAWMPFALLSVAVLIWGQFPVVKGRMPDRNWKWAIPGLHEQVVKGQAATGHPEPTPKDREPALADIVPISSTGTAVFLAAVLGGLFLGVGPIRQAGLMWATVVRLIPAIGAILGMLALGFVTKASGMDVVLGLAFTRTGPALYPVFGTLLGWLGVALTGSDTSSNVLFGNLQRVTAEKLGLSPILMCTRPRWGA